MPHLVEMNKERLNAINEGLVAMLNQLRNLGFEQDEILAGLLFTAGMAMRQRGLTFNPAGEVGQQLPPLVLGYELAQPQRVLTEQQRVLQAKGFVC